MPISERPTDQTGKAGTTRYYHLKITNARRWSNATGAGLYLVRIDEPGPNTAMMIFAGGRMSAKDMRNESLTIVTMLRSKLDDEIVARLSELAECKVGRLTFYFAAQKLKKLDAEVETFKRFIIREKFQEKRNADISHKELPEQWRTHGPVHIPYRTLRRAIGHALRLMKVIDGIVLGPAAKYLWREMRKKRYELMAPASVVYMMLPDMNLSEEIRQRVILEEMAAGRSVCEFSASLHEVRQA